MAEIILTDAQQAALSHDRHIVVTAGAGTGKTEVLIRRYLALLLEPEVTHIQQILALTFTEKAAGEMKHRVYRALLRGVHDPRRPPSLREKFRRFQDQFPANHISTIDAFFAAVIRRFPHVIPGLDPEFRILEGYHQRQLLQETVEDVLDEAATQSTHPCHADLKRLLRGRHKRTLARLLYRFVNRRHFLQPWLEEMHTRSEAQILADWKALIEHFVDRKLAQLQDDCAPLLDVLRGLTPLRPSATDTLVQKREAVLEGFAQEPGKLREALFQNDGTPRRFSRGSKRVWGDRKDEVNACLARLAAAVKPHYPYLSLGWNEALEEEALQDLRALARLLQTAIETYQRRKLAQGALDFADLLIYASRILDDPTIRAGYQRQFRYIMVDEFQDTNLAQWEQIRRLAEDPERPGTLLPDKLFVVGDEKQAIYRFRGGEVEVCDEAQRLFAEQNRQNERVGSYPTLPRPEESIRPDGVIDFDVNFRSEPNLLLFFNTFFEPMLVKREAYEAAFQSLRYRDGTRPQQVLPGRGTVGVFRFDPDLEDAAEVVEARCIAARLRAILDGHLADRYPGLREKLERRERAVGFLFRRRTKQKVYEQALREYGVPYIVARGRGFFARQEVVDLSNALHALCYPHEDIPMAGLLRSPLFAISDVALVHLSRAPGETLYEKLGHLDPRSLGEDDARAITKARELLKDWRRHIATLRPSELLLRVIHTSGVLAPLSRGSDGVQRVSNVYKLVDIARAYEREGTPSLVDFVALLQAQIAEEEEEGEADLPEGGGVQIMTVHQAKGLEFPLVIVADTGYRFQSDQGPYLGRLDGTVVVGWKCARDSGNDEPTTIYQVLQAEGERAMFAEEKRLLYVAFTRAREHLWMTMHEPREGKAPGSLDEAKSWNDWIWLRLQEETLRWVEPLPVEVEPPPTQEAQEKPVSFDPRLLSPW